MNLGVNSVVIRLINNKSVEVMQEWEIKTSIIIHFRENYDKLNSGIVKFNETLSSKRFEILMKNVHTVWCSRLAQDKTIDILKWYVCKCV